VKRPIKKYPDQSSPFKETKNYLINFISTVGLFTEKCRNVKKICELVRCTDREGVIMIITFVADKVMIMA